jgi:hypothetical protein
MNKYQVRKVDPTFIKDLMVLQQEINVDPRFFIDEDQLSAILSKRETEIAKESWMVFSDDVPMAFLTTIVDKLAPKSNNKHIAFFLNFISKNDHDTVETLFKHAKAWCLENDAPELRGPMSSSLSDYRGILVSGYDEAPCIGLPHNPDYYDRLLQSAGLTKAMDMYSYRIAVGDLKKVSRVAKLARIRNPRITIRNFDTSNPLKEIKEIVSIYNRAWRKQWSFMPVSEKDFSGAVDSMQQFFDPEMVKVAVIGDRMVGAMVSVPNVFDPKVMETGVPVHARGMLFGVDSDFQKRGIDALLMDAAINMCIEKGVASYEVGWILESNANWKKQLESATKEHLECVRKYRIYHYLVN